MIIVKKNENRIIIEWMKKWMRFSKKKDEKTNEWKKNMGFQNEWMN